MSDRPSWAELNGAFEGREAVIVGKGPSLDRWIEAGCPRADSAVVIGINNVAAVLRERGVKVEFSVSGDCEADKWLELQEGHLGTAWVRGVPFKYPGPENRPTFTLPKPVPYWYLGDLGEDWQLEQSREEIADRRRLFSGMVSTTPAVQFAWYLGCTSVMLVGVDGEGGRAGAVGRLPDRNPPPDRIYHAGRLCVLRACRVLFGDEGWRDWTP